MRNKKKPSFDIDYVVNSYAGTSFEDFWHHVNGGIENFFPEDTAERRQWKHFGLGMVVAACREKGIEILKNARGEIFATVMKP